MDRHSWYVIPIWKVGWPDPPEGKGSWTFKRCTGQNAVWALFGNDCDGCEPYFKDEWWSFWKWWLRNRFHNLLWFVLGYAWWTEGNPYSSHFTDHLEYIIISGTTPPDDNAPGWQIRFVKPKKRNWLYWRPFICYNGLFSAWIGWKRRGQLACSIKILETTINIL